MCQEGETVLLHCEAIGEGEPLVVLAGFGSDLLSWSFQRQSFSANYRTILVDNRGVGRSATPAPPYSIRGMSEDLRCLLDSLKLERVRLLGHSMGGSIAQEFAIAYPERVERLVLVSSFAKGGESVLPVLRAWKEAMSSEEIDTQVMAEKVLPYLYSGEFFSHPNRLTSVLAFMKAHPYRARAMGLAGQVAAVQGHDTWDRLAEIKSPTLVIAGENDRLTSPAISRRLVERIPDSRFELIRDAGHACMLEQPEMFSELVLSFLGSTS